MMHVLATLAVVVPMIVAPVSDSSAQDLFAPPAEKATVEVATINGSGCPAGTANIAVSSDNSSFTVRYSDYVAQVGVGAAPTDIRQNCQLSLRVHAPSGYTYAIRRADYGGSMRLASGVTAVQSAHYYIQGESETATVSHPFAGPAVGQWKTSDKVTFADLAGEEFLPCGDQRNFNINTELRIGAGGSAPLAGSSFISMDSTSGHVSAVYHFGWKRCV